METEGRDIDSAASKFVDIFLESKKKEYSISYDLTQREQPTGEKVIVVVLRTTPKGAQALKEFSAGVQKAVAGPKGMACPVCGGTGRI